MQQTLRHSRYILPLLIASCLLFAASLTYNTVARAQSNQQVTVGVGITTLTINGQTSPNSFITVLRDTTPIGTTSAGSSGSFSLTITFENGGIYQLSVFGKTPGGDVTDSLSASINVIDHTDTQYFAFLPPTIMVNPTSVTVGDSITLSGETIPNGSLTLTTDDGKTIQAQATSTGAWSSVITASSQGVHSVFGIAYDGLGRQSAQTRNVAYMVNGSVTSQNPPAPITPIGSTPTPAPSIPIITSPQDNQYVNTRNITVTGSAPEGSLVELWQDGRVAGSAYASAENSWSIPVTLSTSRTVLQARTCHFGVCSDFSPSVHVSFSAGLTPGSLFSILEIPTDSLSSPIGRELRLPLLIEHGKAPFNVLVDWGDHSTDRKTFAHIGEFVLLHEYAEPGLYNGTITVEDANNTKDIHRFAVRINDKSLMSDPEVRTSLIAFAVIGSAVAAFMLRQAYIRRKR